MARQTEGTIGTIIPAIPKEGHTAMYSDKEIEKGAVNGPYTINYNIEYPIVAALAKPLEAIGIKSSKKKGEIDPAPRAGYSGRLSKDSERVGEVAYKMMRDEVEAAGYRIMELSENEMVSRYKNAHGWEDISVGGDTIYIAKERSAEKKAEIAFHEYTAGTRARKTGRNHTDFHPEVEKEQVEYINAVKRALMS